MRKTITCLAVGLVIVAGIAFGGYWLYQRNLTSGVRALLVAASDPHSSEMEVKGYIAQARPLLKTKRDRQVFGDFEQGVSLLIAAQEEEQKRYDEAMDQIRAGTDSEDSSQCDGQFHFYVHLAQRYKDEGLAVPADVTASFNDAYKAIKPCVDAKKALEDAEEKEQKQNYKRGIQLLNTARQALGLPPLPQQQS